MGWFKLRAGAGPHREPARAGKPAKSVRAGKLIESDQDLAKLFPNKFDRVEVVGGKKRVVKSEDEGEGEDDAREETRASRISHKATDRQKEPPEQRGLSEDEEENPSSNETGSEHDGPDEKPVRDQGGDDEETDVSESEEPAPKKKQKAKVQQLKKKKSK